MTNEEKQMLLIDLCGRLPYKPIVHARWSYRETDGTIKYKEADRELEINDFYAIGDVKPYLRSIESMTEEEFSELKNAYLTCPEDATYCIYGNIDWLNKKMFDYRGLIEKGLALEAPKDMYK